MTNVRGHNEGTLFLRKRDRRWVAMVTMHDGRRRSASAPSKSEGLLLLRELVRQRDQQIPADPSRLRLGAYLERWLDDVKPRLAPSTWRKHESIIRVHLVPALGGRRLSELSVSDVRTFLDGDAGLDGQTRRHHRATLRRALADAIRSGLLDRNVAALAEAPPLDKAERNTLSAEQVLRITEHAKEERYWPLWVLIANTGLRVNEALGLKWSEFEGAELRIGSQLARHDHEWVRRPLKTRKSRRRVPLTPDAVAALEEQRRRQDVERGSVPRPIDGYIFTTVTGKPVSSTNVLPSWYTTLKRLGLPRVTTHDLRHSTATIAFRAGVPIEVIADLLGHSTTRVTADLYRHRVPELQRDAVGLLARAIRG